MFTPASNLSGPAWKAGKGLLPSGGYGESMGKVFPNGRESKDHSCRKVATSLHDVVFLLSKKIE